MATPQTEITALGLPQVILVVKSNGGSIALEKKFKGEWLTVDTFSSTGAYPVYIGTSATRVTPSGDVDFEVQW